MKKYWFIAFALLGANAVVTSARAADACPFLGLTNASGSPPVVTGSTVNFLVSGLSPVADYYYDGTNHGFVVDIVSPPNTLFTGGATITGVPSGAHTLRAGVETCTVNFTVVPFPSTPTMTQGSLFWEGDSPDPWSIPTYWMTGFQRNTLGAMNPTVTSNNKTYEFLTDLQYCANLPGHGCYTTGSFSVSGSTSDPGKGWLKSISANGRTKTGASASYYYSNGQSTWLWTDSFGFTGSGTTPVQISHN